MKRRIFAALLAVVMVMSFAVIGSAKTYGLAFDSSYDAEKNIVSVKIYVESPGALEAADFCLAYETDVYEFVGFDETGVSDNLITAVGKSILDKGLATCSVMFAEHCEDEDLDENGNLVLTTFKFKPLKEEYDIENFCMWATSYSINDTDIVSAITPAGNEALKEGHTVVVTVAPEKSNSGSTKFEGSANWYIYVIASVVAVGAVAGIAIIAIKNNQEQDEAAPEESGKKDSDSADK